ncbi:MAG: ROK family protein [Planctomycetes bacterium]|nr:ROK family protein [Planctomycetota bacterium]
MTVLACDLGGTRMKIGVVRDGQVAAQTSVPAHSQAGLVPGLPALAAAWRKLLDRLKLSPRDCAGISVAFPSLVDAASGRVLAEYGKYADAVDFDLRGWAKREFNLPLALENDARLALIGEWKYGAGRGSDNVVMITLGTGLGTAAVIRGRVLRGQHGQAGVLGGHLTVRYGGRQCRCGNVGCAEAEASSAFLDELARTHPGFSGSRLATESRLDFAAVFRHGVAGDPCAVKLRDHSLQVWGTLVVNLIHAYDPELVVIGGGIMASAGTILPAIREHVHRHAHTPWGQVRVVAGELGDNAALVPGEWLVREQRPESYR